MRIPIYSPKPLVNANAVVAPKELVTAKEIEKDDPAENKTTIEEHVITVIKGKKASSKKHG